MDQVYVDLSMEEIDWMLEGLGDIVSDLLDKLSELPKGNKKLEEKIKGYEDTISTLSAIRRKKDILTMDMILRAQ